MKELDVKVGDYIYTLCRMFGTISLHKIERLTKTQAVCGNNRFYLRTGKLVGTSDWSVVFGYKADQNIIDKFNLQQATAKVVRWDNSKDKDPELVKAVYELIKND